MSKKLLVLMLIFTFISVMPALSAAPDQYWISFISFRDTIQSSGPPYVMKIDVLGNVLIAPTKVVPGGMGYISPASGATALSQTDRFLVLWIPDAHARGKNQLEHNVFRAVVEKQTLRLVSLRKTSLLVHNTDALQVTQRKQDNFLVVEQFAQDAGKYVGIPLSPGAKILAARQVLFPDPYTCPCEMGISADGRIFFFRKIGIESSNFVIQRLNHDGHPVKEPVTVVRRRAIPADVSNRIDGNRRFILYNWGTLYLRALAADTLEKIGDRVLLSKHSAIFVQTAAIDPLGRFVLYVTGREHPAGESMLVFQALDRLGHKSGAPKIIAQNVNSGLDVLKE